MFFQRFPEAHFDTPDEIIEAAVRVFCLVVLYVLYALDERGRNHVVVHVARIAAVPRIPEKMLRYQPEVFAYLRGRPACLLAFFQRFGKLGRSKIRLFPCSHSVYIFLHT